MKVINVTCESMVNPISITVQKPSFSWKLEDGRNDIYQVAYQVIVLKEGTEVVWDSKVVKSNDTIGIIYDGQELESCTRYSYQITVWNNKTESVQGEECFFETAFMDTSEWNTKWIEPERLPQLTTNPLDTAYKEWNNTVEAMMRGEAVEMRLEGDILEELPLEPYDPAVRLRKTFSCDTGIKRARLYVTAHGIYDVKINGSEITDTLLNPGFTTYDKRIHYQVYGVDGLLQNENAVSVTIADGWYKGKIAIGRGCEYGEVPGLLFKLVIQYENGEEQTIQSDESWKYSYDGPVRVADLFLGEKYDARKDDGDPSVISYIENNWKTVLVKNDADQLLEAQNYPGVRVFKEVPAKRVWTAPNGDLLVDFGQNLAGIIRVEIHGKENEVITFEHGETLDKEGNFFYVFSDSKSKAQRDEYICKGDETEVYQPKFTYHGFRYIRVKGGDSWDTEQFAALAISTDNKVTGAFSCSNEDMNQLQHNIYWSQRTNNITIPTDCPTREKAGWTGDVVVYGATALFNQEMTAFYKDWLKSIRVEQTKEGQIFGTVPQIKSYISQSSAGSLGWGDVILTLPWQLYQLYGDISVLRENYDAMGKWMKAMEQAAFELPNAFNTVGAPDVEIEQMEGRQLENQHFLINSGFHFGDWIIPSVVNELGFSDGPASAFLTMNYADTSLLAHIADLYSEISEILGYEENAATYKKYARRVRAAFAEEYVTKDNKLGQEMQGNYILALKYQMVSEETALDFAKRLNELIENNGYRLDTGFMSTPHMLDVLCDYGYKETAWKVLFQRECPSWLYEVENGATTLWENWDARRQDEAIADCSFNHYAFGCVGDFLYRRVLGIQNDGIGYDKIKIAPEYDVPLNKVEGEFDSARGEIKVCWEKNDDVIRIFGTIPANTTAIICLPSGDEQVIENGTYAFECKP